MITSESTRKAMRALQILKTAAIRQYKPQTPSNFTLKAIKDRKQVQTYILSRKLEARRLKGQAKGHHVQQHYNVGLGVTPA